MRYCGKLISTDMYSLKKRYFVVGTDRQSLEKYYLTLNYVSDDALHILTVYVVRTYNIIYTSIIF